MSHRSRAAVFCIDCKTEDLTEAARFWGEALGEPVTFEEDGTYATIGAYDRPPRLLLQAVDHESRIHLDLETDDREAELRRLLALGAKEVARIKDWIIVEAPTGHRFCLVKPQGEDFGETAKSWD